MISVFVVRFGFTGVFYKIVGDLEILVRFIIKGISFLKLKMISNLDMNSSEQILMEYLI